MQHSIRPTRRSVLGGLIVGAIAAPAYIRPAWAQQKQLVIANFGGSARDAKRKVLYDPFTAETGIEIIPGEGPDMAKMKIQVESGDVEWDIIDMNDAWVEDAGRMGLLEEVDETIVHREGCIPAARNKFACGGNIYAGGIAFPTDRLDGKVAKNWTEFWDVEGIPGRRGLRNRITDTLEIALMGDGIPASEVYPCDVERAFKALDRLKPHVTHWITPAAQTVTLIQQNEVDFTFTYTTRVKDLQAANVPIDYSFQQNILGLGYSGALKGTKNRDSAMRFLDFMMKKDRQVALANLTGDAPTYPDAVAQVDPAVRKWLPEIDNPNNLFTNPAWWNGKAEELTLRFKEWVLT